MWFLTVHSSPPPLVRESCSHIGRKNSWPSQYWLQRSTAASNAAGVIGVGCTTRKRAREAAEVSRGGATLDPAGCTRGPGRLRGFSILSKRLLNAAQKMTEAITVRRSTELVESLINGPKPDQPDLYTLVPCGTGRAKAGGARAMLYPAPAIPAETLARQLQHWLQDELTTVADPRATSIPVPCAPYDPIPEITITESDVANKADGAPFTDPEAEQAYRKWCLKRFGVRVAKPAMLYCWAEEPTEFWDVETLQEMLRVEKSIDLDVADIQLAASNEECANRYAQEFFDAAAVSGNYLTATRNLGEREMDEAERAGPYYKWAAVDCHTQAPWDETVQAADFAVRLAYAFGTGVLVPELTYTPVENDLRYNLHPSILPDETLVHRIAAGEWQSKLDEYWKLRVERVTMFAWVIEPIPPRTTLSVKEADKKHLPDTRSVFDAAGMARDMAAHLLTDVVANDVQCVADNAPASHDVQAAWEAFQKALAATGGRVFIATL